MRIALFGYGKMGKAIERIALQRGHRIITKVDTPEDTIDYKEVDVAIDFSTPQAAFNNISSALTTTLLLLVVLRDGLSGMMKSQNFAITRKEVLFTLLTLVWE
jgi:4-hydroxy-tetrahydrodipicolinate reductase